MKSYGIRLSVQKHRWPCTFDPNSIFFKLCRTDSLIKLFCLPYFSIMKKKQSEFNYPDEIFKAAKSIYLSLREYLFFRERKDEKSGICIDSSDFVSFSEDNLPKWQTTYSWSPPMDPNDQSTPKKLKDYSESCMKRTKTILHTQIMFQKSNPCSKYHWGNQPQHTELKLWILSPAKAQLISTLSSLLTHTGQNEISGISYSDKQLSFPSIWCEVQSPL